MISLKESSEKDKEIKASWDKYTLNKNPKLLLKRVVEENDILVGIVSKTDIIKAISHLPSLQLWS